MSDICLVGFVQFLADKKVIAQEAKGVFAGIAKAQLLEFLVKNKFLDQKRADQLWNEYIFLEGARGREQSI